MLSRVEGMLPVIRQSHQRTQETVDNGIDALLGASVAAVSGKGTADANDNNWYTCVDEERRLQSDLETFTERRNALNVQMQQACERANNTKLSRHTLPAGLRTFQCDRTNSDNACENAFALRNTSMNQELSMLIDVVAADVALWRQNNMVCGSFSHEHRETVASVERTTNNLASKRSTCQGLKTIRSSSICSFAEAWRAKCSAKDAFTAIIESVEEEKGGDLSEPDRAHEWVTTRTAQCQLRNFIDKENNECSGFGFASEVGTINKHEDEFEGLDRFTCAEAEFTFDGRIWVLPDLPENSSPRAADYSSQSFTVPVVDGRFSMCA